MSFKVLQIPGWKSRAARPTWKAESCCFCKLQLNAASCNPLQTHSSSCKPLQNRLQLNAASCSSLENILKVHPCKTLQTASSSIHSSSCKPLQNILLKTSTEWCKLQLPGNLFWTLSKELQKRVQMTLSQTSFLRPSNLSSNLSSIFLIFLLFLLERIFLQHIHNCISCKVLWLLKTWIKAQKLEQTRF